MPDQSRLTRQDFVRRVRAAGLEGKGFAAGKIGDSEQFLLYFPMLVANHPQPRQRRAASIVLGFHSARQSGVFPAGPKLLSRYLPFYVERLRGLDVLGLFDAPSEPPILSHYALDVPICHYLYQEPGRGAPDKPDDCYLSAFAGKRVLIVSPFAELLAARANCADFDAVWAKTGKRWFAPSHVEGLVMPYGWATETQARFADSIALFEHMASEMRRRRFDIALISAGGLGVPLAVEAKRLGAVGVSLGGHLQALFGVLGARWRDDPEWQERYINSAWIDLPPELVPSTPKEKLADSGAYW